MKTIFLATALAISTALPAKPEALESATFWLDAANTASITLGADNQVDAWASSVGNSAAKPRAKDKKPISRKNFSRLNIT